MIYEVTGIVAILLIGVGVGFEFSWPISAIVSGCILLIISLLGTKNGLKK